MTPRDIHTLTPKQMDAAAQEVARRASAQGVYSALIGGYALALYGSPRFTRDVDFAATAEIEGIPVTGRITFGGIHLRTRRGVNVCWTVRDDDYAELYREAVDMSDPVAGRAYRVVTIPYLAAMKLAARRDKDAEDLKFLIGHEEMNIAKTRKLIRRILGAFAAEEFDLQVQEARWLAGREIPSLPVDEDEDS